MSSQAQRLLVGIAMISLVACGRGAKVSPPATQVLPLHVISDYAAATAPEIHLRTGQDVLPGGWAAAMSPVLVDWEVSDPEAKDGSFVLRNVNHGGNPLGGVTVLRSARVPAHGIHAAEFILVPLDRLGIRGVVAHGMLRFLFSAERPGHLLGPDGDEMGPGAELRDLVLSWEAWRAPGVDFDALKGTDPSTFGLTLRAFSGPQRYLEDVLGERDWYAYRLRLPGQGAGLDELLYSSLVLGDGQGRHVLADLFARGVEAWLREAPGGPLGDVAVRARWQELMQTVGDFQEPEDERLRLGEEERTYQTILRSCATMALYCVNVATERAQQLHPGADSSIQPTAPVVMGEVAPWMRELPHLKAYEMFLMAPQVVRYLVEHPTVIPTRIPDALAGAGLLAEGGGKPRPRHYSRDGTSPYGQAGLIR